MRLHNIIKNHFELKINAKMLFLIIKYDFRLRIHKTSRDFITKDRIDLQILSIDSDFKNT